MADELVTPVEDKQIETLKAGASRQDVATLSKQSVETVPELIDPLDPQQVTDVTGLDVGPMDISENDQDSDTIRRLAGSQILALNGEITPELMQIVATDPNISGRLNAEFQKKIDRRREELREALETTFVDSPADMQDNMLSAVKLNQDLSERAAQPDAIEAEVIDSIAPFFDFSEELEKIQKLHLMQANTQAEIWNVATKADIAGDVLGAFLPFNFVLDSDDLTSSKEIQKLFDEPIDSLETLIFAWNGLSAERKIMIWPTLVKEIKRASGTDVGGINITDQNSLKAMAFLDLFMRPDGVEQATFTKQLDLALGAFDAVTFAPAALATLLRVATSSIKRAHIAKLAKGTGNDDLAADITTASIVDEEAAAAANVDTQTAVNNGMPYVNNPILSPELLEGETLSAKVTDNLNGIARLNQQIVTSFAEDSARLKVGLTNQPEREYFVKNEIDKLTGEAEDYWTDLGFYVENMEVVEETADGAKISYQVRDGMTGQLHSTVKKKITWGLNQVTGNFEETVEAGAKVSGGTKRALTSPSFWSRTASAGKKIQSDFFDSFKSASVLEDLVAGDKHTLNLLLQEAAKPLRGVTKAKARKRVDDVLIQGDIQTNEGTAVVGRVFSVRELREGIALDGGGIVRLTSDDEISSYYGARMVSDTLFQIQNRVTKKQLNAIGAAEVKGLGGEVGIGRVFKDSSSARLSAATSNVRIWDKGSFEVVNASSEYLDKAYTQGQKLVRMLEPEKIPGDIKGVSGSEFVDYVLVHTDDLSVLPDVVIHRKPGYVPKINQGVEFLLKEQVGLGTKNGNKFDQTVTLRFGSNAADMQKAKQALIERETARITNTEDMSDAQKAREIAGLDARFKVLPDRELSSEQKLTESFGSSGGLYTGTRSTHDIFYGLNNVDPERLGAFESLQRATAHTGAYYTRNEWRLGEQQRWINTVRKELGGSVDITDFQNTKLGTSPREKILEDMRTQINLWSGMPTKQESGWGSLVQNLHDWSLYGARGVGLTDKASVKSLLWLKHADPFAAAKAAAFHTTLGVMNPVQLYVQGQAFAVALARFPKQGPEAMKYAMRMTFLDMMHNRQAYNANMLKMSKDAPILEEVHKQWLRSGLMQSVRTNADVVAMDSGIGNSFGAMKRVMDAGLIPYRVGELLNRRMSFNLSYLAWKKANKGKVPTDDQLVDIIGDAKMSMLELNRANAARWQGGPDATFLESVLGIMFQFGQVPAKTLELSIKGAKQGGLKADEKIRVLATQAGLFGLVGVPMGAAIFEGISELSGVSKEEMSPEAVNAWNGGLMQVLVSNYIGADVEIASRAALASGTTNFFLDLMKGNEGIGWRVAGAFGTVGERVTTAISQGIYPILGAAYDDRLLTKEDFVRAVTLIFEIPSSSRNFMMAQIMNDMDILYDKKGQTVVWKDFDPYTEIFAAAGFKPSELDRVRNIQADNMDVAKVKQGYVDVYAGLLHRSIVQNRSDFPAKEAYEVADRFLSRVAPNEAFAAEVRKTAIERLQNPETVQERETATWFKRLHVDPVTQMMIDISPRSKLRALEAKTPIIQPLGQQEDLSNKSTSKEQQ